MSEEQPNSKLPKELISEKTFYSKTLTTSCTKIPVLDYIGQISWVMFLHYLDELEQDKADESRLAGKEVQGTSLT